MDSSRCSEDVQVLSGISVGVQTDYQFPPVFYEAQIYHLNKIIETSKLENQKLMKQSFGFFSLKDNDDLCLHYTGLHLVFNALEEVTQFVHSKYGGKKFRAWCSKTSFS